MVFSVACSGRLQHCGAIKAPTRDVLFNNTNSTELVGKSALFVDHDEPVTFSNHFTRLRTIRGLLCPEYLVLWLRARYQEGLFAAICNRWIGQSAVQRDRLLSLELPLLPEQQRIARLVTEQMTAVERARAEHGITRLKTIPLSLRLIRELHAKLMTRLRGDHASPGHFRETQNWIGRPGSGPAQATYVPPPPGLLMPCL